MSVEGSSEMKTDMMTGFSKVDVFVGIDRNNLSGVEYSGVGESHLLWF